MKILWLTWKDYTHPAMGGAEVVLRELSQRLVKDGHEVTYLTVRHEGSKAHEAMDGIEVVRIGTSRYLHPIQAMNYYLKHMRNKYDIVVEAVNTAPYFAALFKGNAQAVVFYHQLARQVWYHELRKPFSTIGYYLLEPLATWLMSRAKAKLITVSESTYNDLKHFGFKHKAAHIISEGIEMKPVESLKDIRKFPQPTMLSLGAVRAMKRTLEQVKAFEIAKEDIPNLKMRLAGSTDGEYAKQVLDYIAASPYRKDITIEGLVSLERKIELMQRSHTFCVTSVKEGWGLVVTEAASQGTPAVVYDVDGLRDSVRDGKTGFVTAPDPGSLAQGVVSLLSDNERYDAMRQAAWEWSKEITFDKSYSDFKTALEIA